MLENYSNFVVNRCPGPDSVWHVAAVNFNPMSLVIFVLMSEHSAIGFLNHDLRPNKGCCRVLVTLVPGVLCSVDHYGFWEFLSLVVPSTQPSFTFRIDAQRKLTGVPGMRLLAGSHTAWQTVENTPSWKLLSRCRSEM